MSPAFTQITTVEKFHKWREICDRNDIFIKNSQINRWKEIVAGFMKTNYLPEHSKRLSKNLLDGNTRFGLSLDKLILRLVPYSQTTQKADLGEAVCCLSFEKLFGLTVPYYKWANKSHIEMPEHGTDVLAFRFEDDHQNDILYLTEVKWRKDTTNLINIIKRRDKGIISKISNLSDLDICDELNLLLKRIENDPKKSELYSRIFNFFDRFRKQPKLICIATFFLIDSEVDLDRCVNALNPLTNLPRELKSYNHLIDNLESVTKEVFEVINA